MLRKLLKKLLKLEEKKKEEKSEEEKIKEEFKEGLTTGYFLRSLKEIENTLNRIEATQATKDWILANFEDKTPELIEWMKRIDEKLKNIEELIKGSTKFEEVINRLSSAYERLQALTSANERSLALISAKSNEEKSKHEEVVTKEMSEKEIKAFEIISEKGEISYEELAKELQVSLSYLRAILSQLAKKRPEIIRFKRDGKGWVKIIK